MSLQLTLSQISLGVLSRNRPHAFYSCFLLSFFLLWLTMQVWRELRLVHHSSIHCSSSSKQYIDCTVASKSIFTQSFTPIKKYNLVDSLHTQNIFHLSFQNRSAPYFTFSLFSFFYSLLFFFFLFLFIFNWEFGVWAPKICMFIKDVCTMYVLILIHTNVCNVM